MLKLSDDAQLRLIRAGHSDNMEYRKHAGRMAQQEMHEQDGFLGFLCYMPTIIEMAFTYLDQCEQMENCFAQIRQGRFNNDQFNEMLSESDKRLQHETVLKEMFHAWQRLTGNTELTFDQMIADLIDYRNASEQYIQLCMDANDQ